MVTAANIAVDRSEVQVMAKILMATWDGAGNFPPEQALLQSLIARGHTVHVIAQDVQRTLVEADGATFVPYAEVTQFDPATPGMDAMLFDEVFFADGYGRDLAANIQRLRPDVALVDEWLVSALGAAQESKIPTVALGNTLHSVIAGTPLQAPNEACGLLLKFSYAEFDALANPPSHAVYVGPMRPTPAGAAQWVRRWPERPFVVASLSTSHQAQEALLQRLCDVLGELPVEALVTTGRGIDPASLTAQENTTVLRHVAHEAVLGQADMLITHAGHGTVMAGATYGVPMLCMPMGRDQPVVAAEVVRLGLGATLEADSSAVALHDAIQALLSDASMRSRSRAFADKVKGRTRAGDAVDLIEGLLAQSHDRG